MRQLHVFLVLLLATVATAAPTDDLQKRLNDLDEIQGDDALESWRELGAAAIATEALPDGIAKQQLRDVHPGVEGWDDAVEWAQANADLQDAIKIVSERQFFGLPYGSDAVPDDFAAAGFSVSLPDLETSISPTFEWLRHLERIAIWSKVEAWRRFQDGDTSGGIELMVDSIGMLRKASDRGFLVEKQTAISLLLDSVVALREMVYLNLDDVSHERLRELAKQLAKVRVDRDRLLMPEHDRFVHQAMIDQAFNHGNGKVDEDAFRRRFTQMQGEVAPVAHAGIDSRWRNLAGQQASLEASREQLDNLYDDWWRRWRVRSGTDLAMMILAEPPYAERLNAVRYAGILATLGDMDRLFADRDRLVVELQASSVASGLAAYKSLRGDYPVAKRMAWGVDVPRKSDTDRFSVKTKPFIYFVPQTDWTVKVGAGQAVIPAGTGILYSRGRDGFDNSAKRHAVDGFDGDLIIWPPISAFNVKPTVTPIDESS